MKLTKTDKQFTQVAGFLGSIQGFAWFIMSLICIILYCKEEHRDYQEPESYMDVLQQYLYFVFLAQYNDLPYEGRFITPTLFDILMWPYLILDLMWLIVSVCLISTKIDNIITKLSKAWSIIVTIISVYDLFVTIMLGVDYDKCLDRHYKNIMMTDYEYVAKGEFCANVILPVLVIAAKGFVLWIVNVAFATILYTRIVKKAGVGTVFHENLAVSFQAPYPDPVPPIVNSLNIQNWENHIYRQQPPTPTHEHPSLQSLNQNQSEHRFTAPNIHNINGERPQHNYILSRSASTYQNLNRNRSDHFDHYPATPTNSSATVPNNNSPNVFLQRPNFVTNNGPQSEHRLQYPVRVPRADYGRAPLSLPGRY